MKSKNEALIPPEDDATNYSSSGSPRKPARSSFTTSILSQDMKQLETKFNSALQLETQGKLNKSLTMYEQCFKSAMEGARSTTLTTQDKSVMKIKAEEFIKAAERVREKLDEKKVCV